MARDRVLGHYRVRGEAYGGRSAGADHAPHARRAGRLKDVRCALHRGPHDVVRADREVPVGGGDLKHGRPIRRMLRSAATPDSLGLAMGDPDTLQEERYKLEKYRVEQEVVDVLR